MPPEPIPKEPVYMSYITRHHQEVRQPSPQRTSPPPFRPYSGLTYTDQQVQSSRAVYPHFHRPFNDHSRYLAVASAAERGAYRDLPRLPPPPWDGSSIDYDVVDTRRPTSAPPGSRGSGTQQQPTLRLDLRGVTLTDNMVTPTGRPCYTMTALVEADLETGTPVVEPPAPEEEWREARVQTYPVPPSAAGYGTGGVRPFHQDYRHYKYFGFAGKGAKTSWAHNPKYNRTYGELFTSSNNSVSPLASFDAPVAQPLQQVVGGPRRRLTAAEKSLVGQFRWHNYDTEGVPTDPKVTRLLAHVATGMYPTPRTLRHLKLPQQDPLQVQAQAQYSSMVQGEIIEPYRAKVDLERRQSVPPETRMLGNNGAARVTTYRQMASPYAGEVNRSPNHGSQSPWHQRYGHYKYSGFAGKGATSSWARNPKYAYMYD